MVRRSLRGSARHGGVARWARLATLLVLIGLAVPVGVGAAPPRVGAQTGAGIITALTDGVALMPQVPVAWRVVRATARPAAEAPFAERALGFLLADRDTVVVAGEGSGERSRVDFDEAVFVPQSVRQQRASAGALPVPYFGLELVVAPDVAAGYSLGSADLIHGGAAFDPPQGRRRLVLHQHVLEPGDTAVLEDTGSPRLVLATSGGIRLRLSGGGDGWVRAGEAVTVSGAVEVVPLDGIRAVFVAATIDDDGGATEVTPGTFSVTTHVCPPWMDIATFEPDACAESRDRIVTWSLSSARFDRSLGQDDAATSGATTTWSDLPAGQYHVTLQAERFSEGYADYFIPSSDQVTRQGFATTDIYFNAGIFGRPYRAYVFVAQPPVEPGPYSVVLDAESCPPGTTLPEIQAIGCDAVTSGFEATLFGEELAAPLTLSQADFGSGQPRWAGLPSGNYRLTFGFLPDGHDTYYLFATPDQGTAVSRVDDPLSRDLRPRLPGFAFSLGPVTTGGNGAVVLHAFFVTSGDAAAQVAPGQPVTVGVSIWDCPPGVVAMPEMSGAGCSLVRPEASGLGLTLAGGGLEVPLTLDNAHAGDGDARFARFWDVPLGDYTLTATLPLGASGYAVRSTRPDVPARLLPDGTGYVVTLDGGTFSPGADPRVHLDAYLLHP